MITLAFRQCTIDKGTGSDLIRELVIDFKQSYLLKTVYLNFWISTTADVYSPG